MASRESEAAEVVLAVRLLSVDLTNIGRIPQIVRLVR